MAALRLKEDTMTGRLTLSMPLAPRLGGVLFGLFWFGFAAVFVLPFASGEQIDWTTALFFIVFAVLPSMRSFFGALTSTTIVIDRGSRAISIDKRLITLPMSSKSVSFGDVTSIELRQLRTNSRTIWMVNAVTRDSQRVRLNWNGSENEINDLAQKVSALVGAPVSAGKVRLPVALEQVLEKIAPNTQELMDQMQSPDPSLNEQPEAPQINSYSPPPSDTPMIDQLSMNVPPSIEQTPTTDVAPSTNLKSLSIQTLEQRIANDPMDSDARYVLAGKYHARGQIDKAIALYQETMRLDPTNASAQNDVGVAMQQRGKRTEAETAYRRAIALDPFSTTAHLNLGLLLRSLNRAADASQEFYQARQNARGKDETQLAEAASTGAKLEPQLSKT